VADHHRVGLQQPLDLVARPGAVAEADVEVDRLVRLGVGPDGGEDQQLDRRVARLEARQARRQPQRQERDRGADGEAGPTALAEEARGRTPSTTTRCMRR
jgi:hypothetical protein